MPNPLFESTSKDKPSILCISFAEDPTASVGVHLHNCDKDVTADMFTPGYATVSGLVDGNTIARRAGVEVGDFIVAVNGRGFRRFAPDFSTRDLDNVSIGTGNSKTDDVDVLLSDDAVVHERTGGNYAALLATIKEIKGGGGDPPLALTLERHGWDARSHSWARFLKARNDDVPASMMMIQLHEAWKERMFPIDLTSPGLQELLKLKAVSEVDVTEVPTVYVNYGKLQKLEDRVSPDEVVRAFVIFTEMMLQRSPDPRSPKTCQFIDLTGVSISQGFRVDILKQIYAAFEPNYPETLKKMVMYPVSKTVAYTSKMLLSFVNEDTQKKFVITDNLETVCSELGWDQAEVEACGGVTDFMHKHEKAGDAMIFG